MAVDVLSEIVIDRPCEQVAGYAADPSHAPDWYVNIASVQWLTEPPVRVGSRTAFVAEFLGRRLAYTYEIAEYVPGERLVMRTAEGPFPMEIRSAWRSDEPERTRMTLPTGGEPLYLARLVGPFVAVAVGCANRNDLPALNAIAAPAVALQL